MKKRSVLPALLFATIALPLLGGLDKLNDQQLSTVTTPGNFSLNISKFTAGEKQASTDGVQTLIEHSTKSGLANLYSAGETASTQQIDNTLGQLQRERLQRSLRRERLTPDKETVEFLRNNLQEFDVIVRNGDAGARIRLNTRPDGFDYSIDFTGGNGFELHKDYDSPDIRTDVRTSDGTQTNLFQ